MSESRTSFASRPHPEHRKLIAMFHRSKLGAQHEDGKLPVPYFSCEEVDSEPWLASTTLDFGAHRVVSLHPKSGYLNAQGAVNVNSSHPASLRWG